MSQKSYDGSPTAYLIPTPIGNMEDITLRAINILKQVKVIFSEDTRVTSLLLKNLEIQKKLISNHQYNERKNGEKAISYLQKGFDIGIVSDRGTPVISDPGYDIVAYIIDHGYHVVGLPGATALIPALITSGISPMPFLFYGFLNHKEGKRKKELISLKEEKATLVFYEAPHRILKTIQNMFEILGNRKISISREISKKYEEIYRGTIENISGQLVDIKGEFVIIVEGYLKGKIHDNLTILEQVNQFVSEGMTVKDAIKEVSDIQGISKNEIYQVYHRGE